MKIRLLREAYCSLRYRGIVYRRRKGKEDAEGRGIPFSRFLLLARRGQR